MSLTLTDVRRIASLSRIAVDENEVQQALTELNGIFGLIGQMQAFDSEGVQPMAHAQDIALRLREDVVTESDQHERFQAGAPQVEAGLYLVPKVIE